MNNNLMSREVEVGSRVKSVTEARAYMMEGISLVVLQVNCRSVYNKSLKFWDLVYTYNSDIVTGTESCLKGYIGFAEIIRADFTTFRRDRSAIAATELCVGDDVEMIAVEVKGMDPKYTLVIIGIYRDPN